MTYINKQAPSSFDSFDSQEGVKREKANFNGKTYCKVSLLSKMQNAICAVWQKATAFFSAIYDRLQSGCSKLCPISTVKIKVFFQAMKYLNTKDTQKLRAAFAQSPEMASNRFLIGYASYLSAHALNDIIDSALLLDKKHEVQVFTFIKEALARDIKFNRIERIDNLIMALTKLGGNLNTPLNKEGLSAIEIAVSVSSYQFVEKFINLGCNINLVGPKGSLLSLSKQSEESYPKTFSGYSKKIEAIRIRLLLINKGASFDSSQRPNPMSPPPMINPRLRLQQILGVEFKTQKEMNAAYRKWSLKNHPDKLSADLQESAKEKMQEVNRLRDQILVSPTLYFRA